MSNDFEYINRRVERFKGSVFKGREVPEKFISIYLRNVGKTVGKNNFYNKKGLRFYHLSP